MSYDILAFDPDAAPADDDMLTWYREQTAAWQQEQTTEQLAACSDSLTTTAQLQSFYRDIIKEFPPMNGPDSATDDDDADTDYCFGQHILYVCLRWGKADDARETFLELARAHSIGVYEVSHNPAVVHRPPKSTTH